MSLPIVLLPEAQAELDAAVDWYEQQAGLGVALIATIQEALAQIADHPRLYAVIYHDARRASVRRFPYSIIYRVERTRVVVIAVIHNRRDPSVWQQRV